MAPGIHTSTARGSDQSKVDKQNFISLRFGVTPRDMKIVTREARERGISRAELLRTLIRQLVTQP